MASATLDIVGKMLEFERGVLTESATVDLFQCLIDTGLAFDAALADESRGAYGKTAVALLASGRCRTAA
jgi:hypothetical protein